MNSVKLYGRISTDLNLRHFNSGTAVLNFNIACERSMTKEKKAEAQEKGQQTADFPRCKAIGKTAELIANYFKKGDLILISEGSIETGSYDGEHGKVYTTEVFVQKFEFVGGNKSSGGAMSGGGSDDGMGNYNPSDFETIDDESDVPF